LRQWTVLALILVAAAALGGCRDEDGRALDFKKGSYGGPAVPKPPSEAAQGWRDHAEKMRF
jgi:hypothetical protein